MDNTLVSCKKKAYKSCRVALAQQSRKMPSLGYLLLFSLAAVLLISPTLGGYYGPKCSKPVSNCQALNPCGGSVDCLGGQTCCDSGCGLRCTDISGFFDFLKNLFPCGRGGCGGGCQGSRCGYQGGYQGGYGGGYQGGYRGKK